MDMLVERLIQIGLFAGQAVIVVIALIVVIGFIFSLVQKNKQKNDLDVENINDKFKDFRLAIQNKTLNKKQLKKQQKSLKKELAQEEKKKAQKKPSKKDKENEPQKKSLFVIDFEGDIKANAVDELREEVSAVLTAANEDDEVLIRIESPGGVVHGYGLAAAQLQRIKKQGLKLTVAVDKVAASGGYMMACVADHILAAPFAIVGSIGVLAQVPNFHRLLKKHEIDYREITAGEYKRTLSLLGEITEKGEEKFREQIVDTHDLFKSWVGELRPKTQLEKVATGEYWYGKRAIDLGLIDEIKTSDEYLFSKREETAIYKISFEKKKKMSEKLGLAVGRAAERAADRVFSRIEWQRFL